MRIDRRALYFPAITLTALTFTLTIIMLISTYRNLHRERGRMEELLMHEGVALLRLFDAAICDRGRILAIDPSQLQKAVAAAPDGDIAYLYLLDLRGIIRAHSDPQRVGQPVDGSLPGRGEAMKLITGSDAERILEVRQYFEAAESGVSEGYYFGIGLKMTNLEQIYHEDGRHRVMMTAILVLLGTATIFFILVLQNFHLVNRTLDRVRSYTQYVVESMANGLISLDANGVVTTINPAAAELTGISRAKALGLSFDSLLPEYADEIRDVLWKGSTILNRETEYRRSDDSFIPVSLSATQVKDSSGSRLGAVIMLNDLREIRELYQRAQRAEHLASIGRMAAVVAHEIRNPLSSIRGLAQYFVANSHGRDEDERTYAQAIVSESDRLDSVVSELLHYASPLELNLEEIHITTLFADTIKATAPETNGKGIEIEQDVPPHTPAAQIDRDRMLQVLLNLTQNSIAAMPDGGRLILRARWLEELQSIRITVEDTGAGISEQDVPRLFEPFFTTRAQGTGLGLAIVHKIVDAHSGKIAVQSEEGKGTKMVLTIPSSTVARTSGAR